MERLEKYVDDPQRHEIIAREMGWSHFAEDNDWSEEVDALANEDWSCGADVENEGANAVRLESSENHSLYRAAFALTVWIDQLFDADVALQNEPAAVKLATHSALASAKLAAALNDDDVDEIGMTIAYLKRALKAITTSLDAAAQLLKDHHITADQHSTLQKRLFEVRDGI